MSKITLGIAKTHNVTLDLDTLLSTRMLLTADSGGGKTYALKRICEQAFGKIQIVIVDPEGEFSPLREKFPFVLAGKGGETPADTRSAALLALRLLETRASCICDIFEMKPSQRHEWVRLFIDGLIEAPKATRHPVLVIVDEAHIFCPEKGKGESSASEAMISLCTRGRKRLLCALFATQRLATLNKDASSMLLNRMIGAQFEDVNRKRAVEVMGVSNEDKAEFNKEIQLLETGYFFTLGRALTLERELVHIGRIETPHGQDAQKYDLTPPPPPDQVRKLLPKLIDLPAEAEEKAKTVADLKTEIRELKKQLKNPLTIVQKDEASPAMIERAVRHATKIYAQNVANDVAQRNRVIRKLETFLSRIHAEAAEGLKLGAIADVEPPQVSGEEIQNERRLQLTQASSPHLERLPAASTNPRSNIPMAASNGDVSAPQLRILRAIREFEAIGRAQISKAWIAARAGASYTSSTFTNNLGALRSAGYLTYPVPDTAALTEQGREAAGAVKVPEDSEEMLASCLNLLSGPQQAFLRALYAAYPHSVEKNELAGQVGVSAASSTYTNNLGAMRTAGMITYPNKGHAKCAEWIFIE